MPTLLRIAPPPARRWLGAAALAFAPALVVGCGDSTTSPSDIAGTYAMVSIDGQPLPYTDNSSRYYTDIYTDGQLLLGSDRRYRVEVTYHEIERATGIATTLTDSDTGTYTLSGNSITLRSDDTSSGVTTGSGTVSGSTITVEGYTFVRR